MTIAPLLFALLAAPAANRADAPVILDFTASWCGPCQQMKPAVAQLIKSGYPVKAVDIDASPAMAKRYQVDGVPTFVVVDSEGRELDRLSGFRPAGDIAKLYRSSQAKLKQAPRSEEPQDEPAAEAEEADDDEPSADAPPKKNPLPWETVVRIKIENHLSRPPSLEFGSGTIIYSTPDEAIILTCAHIFRIHGSAQQYPPSKFPLKIEVHLSDGQLRRGKQAQVQMVDRLEGEAIDYSFAGDVGLIRIRPGRRLPATPVVGPDWKPTVKMPMTTVGCSSGNPATAWSTYITNPLVKGVDGYPNYEAIECAYPPKQGRSGGGLYTLDGRLAGVCDFAEPRDGHGLYATPRTIHKLLDRNNLTLCYAPDAGRSRTKAGTLVAQGQRPRQRNASNVADTLRAQDSELEPRPSHKKLTIPSPDQLNIADIGDESDAPARPASANGNRRKPPWTGANGEGRELVSRSEADAAPARLASGKTPRSRPTSDEGERPQPAGITTPPSVDRDPFAGIDEPRRQERRAKSPSAPAVSKPKTGQVWKPARSQPQAASSDR